MFKIKNKVTIEKLSCTLSPEDVFAIFKDSPHVAFLNSSMSTDAGRYSFLGLDPFLSIQGKGTRLEITSDGITNILESDPFDYLKSVFRKYHVENTASFPFIAGGIGYFSYDLKNLLEDLPCKTKDDLNVPEVYFSFHRAILIFDKEVPGHLFVSVFDTGDLDPGAVIRGIKETIEASGKGQEQRALGSEIIPQTADLNPDPEVFESNFTKEEYLKAVERVKEHIRAGDIYQACLSQRFHTVSSEDASEIYLRLNCLSPAPFSAYLNTGDLSIISSSPELFLRRRGDIIETRPMKGTRPRGETPEKDSQIRSELEKSSKDISELLMIVDLERNDIGRIARPGSVVVTEPRRMEAYSTVFQTIAVIKGSLKKTADNIDIVKATFPGGSITGCPKIRSMGIIDAIEPTRRGIYTGAMGYLSFHDTMDLNIAIRTMLKKGNDLYFQVGGGIVAESEPEAEYEETLVKAKAIVASLKT